MFPIKGFLGGLHFHVHVSTVLELDQNLKVVKHSEWVQNWPFLFSWQRLLVGMAAPLLVTFSQ